MLTMGAYSSRHLTQSHLGLAYVLLVETNHCRDFPDNALRMYLGIFSSLPYDNDKGFHRKTSFYEFLRLNLFIDIILPFDGFLKVYKYILY